VQGTRKAVGSQTIRGQNLYHDCGMMFCRKRVGFYAKLILNQRHDQSRTPASTFTRAKPSAEKQNPVKGIACSWAPGSVVLSAVRRTIVFRADKAAAPRHTTISVRRAKYTPQLSTRLGLCGESRLLRPLALALDPLPGDGREDCAQEGLRFRQKEGKRGGRIRIRQKLLRQCVRLAVGACRREGRNSYWFIGPKANGKADSPSLWHSSACVRAISVGQWCHRSLVPGSRFVASVDSSAPTQVHVLMARRMALIVENCPTSLPLTFESCAVY